MMRILTREGAGVTVHVHGDFSGDAIIVALGIDEAPTRYAEVPTALLMRGDFDLAATCQLTDREVRIATSITLDGYLTACADAAYQDLPEAACQ